MREKNYRADQFAILGDKLSRNVYGSIKGQIRLKLLQRDIEDFCPHFSSGSLRILDIGGGGGHFSLNCANKGHSVLLVDKSSRMIAEAKQRVEQARTTGQIEVVQRDFLHDNIPGGKYDLVAMHGSAEWMADPEKAISKAADFVCPGGLLSILLYNRDRHIFKRGVSGQLLIGEQTVKKSRLTPPGARSAQELLDLLARLDAGKLLLKSGIRVFQGFFRSVPEGILDAEEWYEQELRYYRREPFASLGEHTHCIWQRTR